MSASESSFAPSFAPLPTGGRLTIDLGALAANWRWVAALARPADASAVVKADAYGVGLTRAVRALAGAGCRTFFVALVEEGIRARAAAPDAAIYVLNGLMPGTAALLAAADLRPVLNTLAEIEAWAAARFAGPKPAAAIHVDTGINRLGLSLAEAAATAARSDLLAAIDLRLLVSHLACADTADHPRNAEQLARFQGVRRAFAGIPASFANSGGVALGKAYHFDLVRPGIALYGGRWSSSFSPLAPVVTAEAQILGLRDVVAGETLGYGAAETAKRSTRVAILACGYADGFHRLAGSSDARPGGSVFLRGRRAPLIGRVSMDLMAVDVTGIPNVQVGDFAELYGHNLPLDEAAAAAETIGYELLTGVGRRFARRYVGGSAA